MVKILSHFANRVPLFWKLRERYSHYFHSYTLVEHPKCGRTWIRHILNCFFRRASKYNIRKPLLYYTHDGSGITKKHLNTKMIKANVPSKQLFKKKIVLIMRDPKDALVSFYFQATKRRGVRQVSLSRFIRSSDFGAERFITFYDQYLNYLTTNKEEKEYLVIQYEKMHEGAYGEMVRLIRFLGFDTYNRQVLGALKLAIEESTFEKMRAVEEMSGLKIQQGSRRNRKEEMLSPADVTDMESYKTRRGIVGGFVDYLSVEDIDYINQAIQKSQHLKAYYG